MTWDHPKILVVDDSLTDRIRTSGLIQKFLPAASVEVLASGEEAIAQLQQEPFDLIVTDLVMPESDGRDLLDSIQELPNAPAVILVTAQGNERVAAACLRRGAIAYLRKESLAQELGAALSETQATLREEAVHQQLMTHVTQARCEFEIDSDLQQIQALSNFLAQRLRTTLALPSQKIANIISGVHEALLNAHFHGNMKANESPLQHSRTEYMRIAESNQQQPEYADCRIRLVVSQQQGCLQITVKDGGRGFDHGSLSNDTDSATMTDRGTGIRTMKQSVSRVSWNDSGNEVTLTHDAGMIAVTETSESPAGLSKENVG